MVKGTYARQQSSLMTNCPRKTIKLSPTI